ncbi:RNA polymerase sigma factor [Paenibacillus eucommiae]|uniref:RNA polymerase sigma-70 factor (ECF subfamily) n=1 Tax=Paenibacillus eucommiae TaxID=1355755 RepID=A0ABS4JA27_9BACL|nr:RNA polymerase sigma factor [Paenibacillus eucommiae]MBP1996703.1 RNA polymerase sigma-70 factor (ECF subfamily) [Paenibacillus eucommiae]
MKKNMMRIGNAKNEPFELFNCYIDKQLKGGLILTAEEFFYTFKLDVERTCFYMLQHRQDAEDMCQEVFVKAIQSGFKSIENKKPWLLSITMNMCRNHLKRKNREVLLNRLKQIFVTISVENTYEGKEMQTELQIKLQQLPERIRSVLVLKYLHQMKNEEVAQILHIPVRKIKM